MKLESDMGIRKIDYMMTDLDDKVMETMAFTGCGYMMRKKRFIELGKCWEQLGRWGNTGAEWALKIWLSGGRVLVHRDVICGHLFRNQYIKGHDESITKMGMQLLGSRFQCMKGPEQIYPLNWLGHRFNNERYNLQCR